MKISYKMTINAAFLGYIVQAVVNNFVPLLFLTFHKEYGLPLSQITLLITFNFGVQLCVDLFSPRVIDRIGYRAGMLISNAMSAAGFVLLTILPTVMREPFHGILIAVMVYAIGGGLQEVLVSPIVEACPTENKETAMSLLHSFYCWGHVGVVLISSLFFRFVGIEHWRIMALLWCILPAIDFVLFTQVPIASVIEEGERGLTWKELAGKRLFWMILIMMICAGASEQAVSQWASTFAEQGLGVSKTLGDLMGPMFFAVCMGTSRTIYGKMGEKLDLHKFMVFSTMLCVASYLLIAFVPSPLLALIGCGICGFSVGIFWPGTFSMAASGIRNGGTLMFALLALAGDIGCAGGPTFAGEMANLFGNHIRAGIGIAMIFPVLLGLLLLTGFRGKREEAKAHG